MIENILQNYYLYNLNNWLRTAVQNCSVCLQRGNLSVGSAPLRHLFANYVNEKVYIDLIGKLPRQSADGYSYILNVVDSYSKHLTAIPLRNNQADTILNKLLTHYIYIYGYPRSIISDNANEFVGSLMQDFCKNVSIKYIRIPAYHPQGNGVVERVNASLKTYLYKLAHEKNWTCLDLAACTFAFNTAVHSSLKETPYFMRFKTDPQIEATILYDRNARISVNSQNQIAMEIIVKNYERMTMAQNHLHATFERTDRLNASKFKNNEFQVGSPVLVRNFRKTFKSDPRFVKGYVITEKVDNYSYNVKNNQTDNVTKYHVSDLKNDLSDPYYLDREVERIREEETDEQTRVSTDDEEENEPSEPIDDRSVNRQTNQPPVVTSGRELRPRGSLRKPRRYSD